MTIAFYVSGHGFGHASRSVELIRELLARRRDLRLSVRTAAPSWLFQTVASHAVEQIPCDADVGVVQIDSLNVDERETARRAASFYGDFDRLVEEEAAWLAGTGVALVLGDIPPLAFAAAARASVPSVAVGNFTWDWIYAGYEAFSATGVPGAAGALEIMRAAYATAARALRLPLHGGFEPMTGVTTDIPFIARRSTRDRLDTRRQLGVTDGRPFVLASFSAVDLDMPYRAIADAEGLTVAAPGLELPDTLTYPDLVAAADVVISKPGYGIVSECIANGTPLLYTSRGRFVEYDLFVAEMPRVLRCRYLAQADFLAGRWGHGVRALLAEPAPPEEPRINGAAIAADTILEILDL